MKKTGLLLILLASSAWAQQAASEGVPAGVVPTSRSLPIERIQTPSSTDLYCAGFISKQLEPNVNYIGGGLQSPSSTRFANGDIVYLYGSGYQVGSQYTILRESRDPNRYESFVGQHSAIAAAGQPYAEMGRLRVIDTRSKMAIGQIEFSCDTVAPGDLAVPFVEKPKVAFHPPSHFDVFIPATGKTSGRILMARDFDSVLGTGMKVYMNIGSNQGVKVGDYFRAVRSYMADLKDPVDSLSFRASTAEDTQKAPPVVEPNVLTYSRGEKIRVEDMPRRGVGEIVVIGVTPTTATGMIVYALEDVHVGDAVELDEQTTQAQLQ
jgi:hypothetical protein